MQNKNNKLKSFFKLLAMDGARIIASALIPYFRMKRLTPDGQKYKGRIKGGALIAANHTSYIDPFVVGIAFWYRRMNILIAKTVMGGRIRSALLRGAGGIKIDRHSTDLDAIKEAVEVLKKGRLLAIFPQGGINAENDVHSLKSGAVFMALRAGTPIVPMYIRPKKHWYSRKVVVIGETIYPSEICPKKMPNTADIENITKILADGLAKCKNAI